MKKLTPALLLLAVLLCGCAHNYVITMDNGRRVTTASKPKLRNAQYVFKDALGREQYVPAGRVREIAPQSMASQNKPIFNPQPQSR